MRSWSTMSKQPNGTPGKEAGGAIGKGRMAGSFDMLGSRGRFKHHCYLVMLQPQGPAVGNPEPESSSTKIGMRSSTVSFAVTPSSARAANSSAISVTV